MNDIPGVEIEEVNLGRTGGRTPTLEEVRKVCIVLGGGTLEDEVAPWSVLYLGGVPCRVTAVSFATSRVCKVDKLSVAGSIDGKKGVQFPDVCNASRFLCYGVSVGQVWYEVKYAVASRYL